MGLNRELLNWDWIVYFKNCEMQIMIEFIRIRSDSKSGQPIFFTENNRSSGSSNSITFIEVRMLADMWEITSRHERNITEIHLANFQEFHFLVSWFSQCNQLAQLKLDDLKSSLLAKEGRLLKMVAITEKEESVPFFMYLLLFLLSCHNLTNGNEVGRDGFYHILTKKFIPDRWPPTR